MQKQPSIKIYDTEGDAETSIEKRALTNQTHTHTHTRTRTHAHIYIHISTWLWVNTILLFPHAYFTILRSSFSMVVLPVDTDGTQYRQKPNSYNRCSEWSLRCVK